MGNNKSYWSGLTENTLLLSILNTGIFSIIYVHVYSSGKRGGGKIIVMKKWGGGGGKWSVHDSTPARGVWGHAPPEIFFSFISSEIVSGVFSDSVVRFYLFKPK